MSTTRTLRRRTSAAILALAGAFACAQSAPDMAGFDPAAFYARFSGEWEAEEGAQADVLNQLQQAREQRGPGGVRAPGAGDRERVLAAVEVARHVPPAIVLALGDSVAEVRGLHPVEVRLPISGERVESVAAGSAVEIRLLWEGQVLVIERSFGPAQIIDRFVPSPDGDRLLVTRRVAGGPGESEVHFAYARTSPAGP
jgi:hypothetical protein